MDKQDFRSQIPNPFHSLPRMSTFTQLQFIPSQSNQFTTAATQPQLKQNPLQQATTGATTQPISQKIVPGRPQNKTNKPANKLPDEDVKSHPLFKNMQSQVETCRGINVQLSTKITRLEETVRILETKNLYQQEELQKVKGINEGMQNSKKDPNPPFCPPSNCKAPATDPRVLI